MTAINESLDEEEEIRLRANEDAQARDPDGVNQMTPERFAEFRAGQVRDALAVGRTCQGCPNPPAEIVLSWEVEYLLCAEHAAKAHLLHAVQVDFYGGEPEQHRIIRWSGQTQSQQEHFRQRVR